jgi:mannose-P-dolichol utilization defect 1
MPPPAVAATTTTMMAKRPPSLLLAVQQRQHQLPHRPFARPPPSAFPTTRPPPPPRACAALAAPRRRRQAAPPPSAAAAAIALTTTTVTATATATASPFAAAAAVALGYLVMAGSLVRSVPQIAKVWKAKSAEGLSLTSVAVELLCYTVSIAYNASRGYPWNTYGEVAACWLQDVLLVVLVVRFGAGPRRAAERNPRRAVLLAAAFSSLVAWLLSPWCPHDFLAAAQAANVAVLALGSRVPQIWLNVRRGDAGLLSATSCALNVAGNAARAFTTIVLTRDALLLAGAVTQGALNGVLTWQALETGRRRRRDKEAAALAAAAAAAAEGGDKGGAAAADVDAAAQQRQDEAEEELGPAAAGGGPAPVYAAG